MIVVNKTDNEITKDIGRFCKQYRKDYLNITMSDFAETRGLNLPSVSAFESGRSSNIKFMYHYYLQSSDIQKKVFKNEIFNIVESEG